MLFQQRNGRQEAFTMQTVRVEHARRIVGSHHQNDPLGEQAIEQATENHRIGNIGNVELVKAQQTNVARDLFGNPEHRVRLAFVFVQITMDLLHEGMKVNTLFAAIGHGIVEAIHQEAFAPANAAPEINTLRRLGRREQALEGVVPPHLEIQQTGVEILQSCRCRHLGNIRNVAAGRQQGLVGFKHATGGDF
jgi:hypothetical protein